MNLENIKLTCFKNFSTVAANEQTTYVAGGNLTLKQEQELGVVGIDSHELVAIPISYWFENFYNPQSSQINGGPAIDR